MPGGTVGLTSQTYAVFRLCLVILRIKKWLGNYSEEKGVSLIAEVGISFEGGLMISGDGRVNSLGGFTRRRLKGRGVQSSEVR